VRRGLRALAWLALSLALAAAVGALALIAWARSPSGRRNILSFIVAEAQLQFNGTLSVGRLDGNLTRELMLRDVRIFAPDGRLAARVDALDARYHVLGLLARPRRIDSLSLNGAWADLERMRALSLRPDPPGDSPSAGIEIVTLHGDATLVASVLHGALRVEGQRLRWEQAAIGDLPVELGDLQLELRLAPWHGELQVTARAAKPPSKPIAWQAQVTAHDLDPHALHPALPHGRVALRVQGRGEGRAAAIDLDEVRAETDGTRLSASGTAALGATPAADLRVALESPDLSRLPGLGLHGAIDLRAHVVRAAAHMHVDATVHARRLRLAEAGAASLDAEVHALDWNGHARVTAADVELRAPIRLRESSLELAASADGPRLALSLDTRGPDGVIGRLRAHGTRLAGAIEATLDELVVGARGEHWHATAPGRLRVDGRELSGALSLAASDQRLSIEGTFDRAARELHLSVSGRRLDAHRLARLARREAPVTGLDLDARLDGPTARPSFTLALHGWTGPSAAYHLPALALVLDAAGDARHVTGKLDASGEQQRLHARIDAPLDPDQPLSGDLQLTGVDLASFRVFVPSPWPQPLRGLSGMLNARARLSGTVRHAALHAEARVPDHDLVLTLDGALEHRRVRARLDAQLHGTPLLLAHAEAGGSVGDWRDAPLRVDATVPSYDLSRLRTIEGQGTLVGRLALEGTLARPVGRATLEVKSLRVGDMRFARVDSRAEWNGEALTAALTADGPSGALRLAAHLPADPLAPLEATLEADALVVAIRDLGDLRTLDGRIDADLRLTGPRAHAHASGFLRIDGGAFARASDPRSVHDLRLDLAAHDGSFELRRLHVDAEDGSLGAHGSFALDGWHLSAVDLEADARRFPFQAANTGAWLNARAELRAATQGNRLTGSLTVSRGTVELEPSGRGRRELQSTEPLEDVVLVGKGAPKARRPPLDAEVIAYIPGPFEIQSSDLDARLRGELVLRLTAGVPQLLGWAEAAHGRVELLGRPYEIARAHVSFDGRIPIDPSLNLRLTRAVRDATIAIDIRGTAGRPEVALSSDPPIYDTAQIVGIIVSGNPGNQRVSGQAADELVVGALSGVVVGRILDQIAPGLPIDVIRVGGGEDQGGLAPRRLEIGHYITDRIYVGYAHQFGDTMSDLHRYNTAEATVEYRLGTSFTATVRYGDGGVGGLTFSWIWRF
jgi:autotransporter translocation and assembly factor TamB